MRLLSYPTVRNVKLSLRIKVLSFGFIFLLIFGGEVKAQTFTFNTAGVFSFTVPTYSGSAPGSGEFLEIDIDVIIVGAGGGGGRGEGAGGGGGGQVVQTIMTANEGDVLTGNIGAGGLGSLVPNAAGSDGVSTIFNGTTALGGLGGGGGNTGTGGNSGSNQNGGGAATPQTTGGNTRRAGGGGGGAGGAGNNGNVTNSNGIGGDGGPGILGYAGGGGGVGRGNGSINSGNSIPGDGSDGGTSGSTGNALNASNGGGGGGGITQGGNGGNGVVVITVSFRVLPVEYLYFKADFNASQRLGNLSWSTAKEWENSHFEVERSVNDVKSWETIGQVMGAGNSFQPVEYKFQDLKLPLAGGNIFYRLKQVDIDGDFGYSDTRAIQVTPLAGTTYWRVYPNPTTGHPIHLELLKTAASNDEKVTVRIISSTGQFDVIEGSSSTQLSLQLSDLLRSKTEGIYTLEITWDYNREYHTMILRR